MDLKEAVHHSSKIVLPVPLVREALRKDARGRRARLALLVLVEARYEQQEMAAGRKGCYLVTADRGQAFISLRQTETVTGLNRVSSRRTLRLIGSDLQWPVVVVKPGSGPVRKKKDPAGRSGSGPKQIKEQDSQKWPLGFLVTVADYDVLTSFDRSEGETGDQVPRKGDPAGETDPYDRSSNDLDQASNSSGAGKAATRKRRRSSRSRRDRIYREGAADDDLKRWAEQAEARFLSSDNEDDPDDA